MSHILSQDIDTGRSSFTDFQNTSMSMTLGLLNVGGSATRIISRAIINQNHQHFQNVFIVQLSCAAASVVGPGLVVVSGGSTPGLRVAGTGFKQAYFDSKFVSACQEVLGRQLQTELSKPVLQRSNHFLNQCLGIFHQQMVHPSHYQYRLDS